MLLGIHDYWVISQYDDLRIRYSELSQNYSELEKNIFGSIETNSTVITIVYYTNFGKNQQIMTISIPYNKYDSYHKKFHPYWGKENLTSAKEYITSNETIINQIVKRIKNQTKSEEELANTLLDFVQDKGFALSIRYYPTTELKFPIETLVEMGGDCDTHSFLYATLMKAAGFKVLILLSKENVSNGLPHVAVAIHLTNPPTHFTQESYWSIIYQDEEYYFAETTYWGWRVGDLPSLLKNVDFYIVPI